MPACPCSWKLSLLAVLIATPLAAADVDPFDWPYWRGPEMNGISREKNLPDKWDPESGESVVWQSEELGTRSTPIVLNNRLYTLCRDNPHSTQECEKVVCADATTGEILWRNKFNVFLSDVPDTRVGWSSVVGDPETGNVYALGVCGLFQCIDGESGKTLWSHSLSEEAGILTTYGGRTNFPIVFENLVIISGVTTGWGEYSTPAFRIMAFDKQTGQSIWIASTRLRPADTTYSAPVIAVIDGEAQFIIGSGDGAVYGLQPRTGKILWNFDVTLRGVNATPLVIGDKVFCGHGEENSDDPTKMGAFFAIDATKRGNITKTGNLWKVKEQFISKGQPLAVDDIIYGIDESGTIFIDDIATGKMLGKKKIGTVGRGSAVYGDGKIYVCDATGRWFIFEPNGKDLKMIHSLRLGVEVNGSPIISHGKVFLPTETMMYAIGNSDVEPEADPRPELPAETSPSEDQTPATALVVPVETLLKPGEKQALTVSLFNAKGQLLKTAEPGDVKFEVAGAGKVDAEGVYQAPKEAGNGAAAVVTASIGEIKATARLRVVPDFPWKFTYDDGVVPITGVGMRYRNIGIDHDYFTKVKARNPLAAKLYIFLTTTFTNSERPAAKLDDATPQQGWSTLRRYLGMYETVLTQDQGKEALDPALKVLQEDGVIKEFSWTGNNAKPQLSVAKGPRKLQGNGVMCKITTIPLGTRSQGWLGRIDSKNYVIQADAMANKAEVAAGADPNAKMPDIGVINQRYRLEMMGAAQQLKVYSWYPHDQKVHIVAYPWEPDTWYTLKFQVNNETRDGVEYSVCRGKVWKKAEAEPKEWSIEWADTPANDHGSPGLFGNAKDTEIFFDNVIVTPQKK